MARRRPVRRGRAIREIEAAQGTHLAQPDVGLVHGPRGRRCGEMPAGEAVEQPRRDRHGDEERENHGHRSVGRDRAHVGAHQAAHEHHGQQCHDDRERRHDRRIADLGDRLDGRGLQVGALAVFAAPRLPVPHDVLDDHDGVVDQDADREDQREQADAVDRVAHQPGRKQRQQDGGRDHYQHDQAFPPAHRQGDQQHDRHGREPKMEEQLVCLLSRGLPVVAADRDGDVVGHQAALHGPEPRQQAVGHHHGVGAARV